MTPQETKQQIQLILHMFLLGDVSMDEATRQIVNIFQNGQIFNGWSFFAGAMTGMILLQVALAIFKG